jgi:anaerobic magnesium-protoporphyrin IX monomethyl ester cyclase
MNVVLIKAGILDRVHPMVVQPLGILYLAAVVREAGHNVTLIDAKAEGLDLETTLNRVERSSPDIVGISGFSNEWESFEHMGSSIKKRMPEIFLIGGGPYATSFPEKILARAPFDYLVIGEGEVTFIELLDAIEKKQDMDKVAGLAFRENGQVKFTPSRPFIENLDSIPLPAYDLLEMDLYSKNITASPIGRRRNMTIMTTRGCPYQCIYCHNLFGKRFRAKSVDKVLEELVLLVERYNIKNFEICDDIFNLDRDRLMEICSRIIKEKLDVRLSFPTGLRGDKMDKEMIVALRKAGTVMIAYAVESASPRIQKLIKKNLDLDKINKTINETVRQGIFTHAFFMLGFPTETEDEMNMTIDFAARTKLHTASFFIVTPFKATELWNFVPRELQEKVTEKWFSFHGGYMNISDVPTRCLMSKRQKAYLKFFFNPMRIVRIVYRHPDKKFLPEALQILLRQLLTKPITA